MPTIEEQLKAKLQSIPDISPLLPDSVEIKDILAVGGQGIVYTGKALGEDAAIKIYFPGQLQQRIDREIQALRLINCPCIVRLIWQGTISMMGFNLPMVGTELIKGRTVAEILHKKPMTFDELGVLAYDVSVAIKSMWEHRIVHRDLKPSNIMIDKNMRACVIDLGIARHVERTPLTATGFIWGTLGYYSPEQMQPTRPLTCKSDIYALGINIVECAEGRHPSQGDQFRLFTLGLHEMLPSSLEKWEYADLIKRMLHPRQTVRPNPDDVIDRLAKYK